MPWRCAPGRICPRSPSRASCLGQARFSSAFAVPPRTHTTTGKKANLCRRAKGDVACMCSPDFRSDAIDLACRLRCGDSDADRLKLLFAPPGEFEDPALELGPPPLLEPFRHRRGRPELQLQVKRVVAHGGV